MRKVLRLKDLIAYIRLSRSVIYDRMDEKSERYDRHFPKSFNMGGKAVGWYKEDIDTWLALCASGTSHQSSVEPPNANVTQVLTIESAEKSNTHQTLHPQPSGSLAEMITEGGQINALIEGYLRMQYWTPAMGALLVNGVIPPDQCNEIPNTGIGLDGIELLQGHSRLNASQKVLNLYLSSDEDELSPTVMISPLNFYIWCDESNVNTIWLRHFNAVGNITRIDEDLSAATFALLTRR